MRLVALFLGIVAAALLVIAGLNRWVDPFGEYYDRRAFAEAVEGPHPCLIAQSLIGRAWLPFKEQIVRWRDADTVVVGTSRVMGIHSRDGERRFANLGLANVGVQDLVRLFERLQKVRPEPLTVYLGVEPFWFNRSWPPTPIETDLLGEVRYLLARNGLRESVSRVLDSPQNLGRVRWEERRVGDRCVLDRKDLVASGQDHAWDVDGSIHTSSELTGRATRALTDRRSDALPGHLDFYYRDWRELDRGLLRDLEAALALAESYGWRVVGFAVPYSARFVERLSTAPGVGDGWREYAAVVPALMARYGFPFIDLRDVRDVPCGEDDFAYDNDGWHPSRACSMRVRDYLEAAAEVRWPAAR
jgi:hypothetical protein